MELELKHLAPYLPYGLKVKHTTFNELGEDLIITDDLESLHNECATFSKGMDYYFEDSEDNDCIIKPLLEPLSNLTKTITRNGVTFVAMDELHKLFAQSDLLYFDVDNIELQPYIQIQQLIEWRVDVFGLIDKGLAIECTNEYN